MHIVLASQSKYKKLTLEKLNIPFDTLAPYIDETARENEPPDRLVIRLAEEKAKAILNKQSADLRKKQNSFIIGVDQVAVVDGVILGKAGTEEKAVEQLTSSNGKRVKFLTGIALLCSDGRCYSQVEPYIVEFKQLTTKQITQYVISEKPIDCAGSFKCEGKGILLFKSMEGRDINSLVGMPLLALQELFLHFDIDLFDHI